MLGDVIKRDNRRVNFCTAPLDCRNSVVCRGVRKWHAPLECSTWSSKVTELLLFAGRLLPCWWWEEPSVEKLSSSITSVSAWAPIHTHKAAAWARADIRDTTLSSPKRHDGCWPVCWGWPSNTLQQQHPDLMFIPHILFAVLHFKLYTSIPALAQQDNQRLEHDHTHITEVRI